MIVGPLAAETGPGLSRTEITCSASSPAPSERGMHAAGVGCEHERFGVSWQQTWVRLTAPGPEQDCEDLQRKQ